MEQFLFFIFPYLVEGGTYYNTLFMNGGLYNNKTL